jgi:predicted nuclease with TOPRIM domain
MKKHWKEACDSVLQLQLQLEQKNAEAFNLQRHDSHTKRLIAHLQEEVRKVLQSKDGLRKYQEANQLLSNMLTELEVDNGNLSKKLSDVEEALHKKNEQYEGLKDDYSKLKQLYRLLETRAKLDGERIAGLPNKPLASHSSRRHESRRSQDNIVLPPENIPGQIAQRATGSD